MSDERWIVIPNWERFQHYNERDPTWIKNYTRLLDDDAYLGLTPQQRGVLHGLWMLYAKTNGEVRDNTARVSRKLGVRVLRATLEALNHAGFIEFSASKSLAQRQRQKLKTPSLTEADSPANFDNVENPLTHRLLTEIRDADVRTEAALHGFEGRLPDAAFAAALESLKHRRGRTETTPLTSEARYVVAALKRMDEEGQYRA